MHKPELNVPEQTTAQLSFCDASPKAFEAWVSHLPMANLGELSRQLYRGIIELNQLVIPATQRLQLLELIRPRVRFACRELARHYLGQAIALSDKQRKVANLSQALQLHLSAGYKLCLLGFLGQGNAERLRKPLTLCSQRILAELGETLLRAHQLYCPSPARSWLESHQVYRFAREQGLADAPVMDDELRHGSAATVAATYVRILLLGCARPNQLRQSELEQTYQLFELWAGRVVCSPESRDSALFVVNMETDSAPVYRSLLAGQPEADTYGVDTSGLTHQLSEYLGGTLDRTLPGALPVPDNISATLLTHLAEAVGVLTQRNFDRTPSSGTLEVCAGLTAVHFFVAGSKAFNEFVVGNASVDTDADNPFMGAPANRGDAWANAPDVGPPEERITPQGDGPITYRAPGGGTAPGQRNRPRSYMTRMVNTSPDGYCVVWSSDIPASLQTGEVLGVRESGSQSWSIALVRWLRQTRNQGTQVGIERIAPSAAPCGVRLVQKTGNSSEFLRGLLLPEIDATGQVATLITPRLPFQAGSRITLLCGGREDQGLLEKQQATTGSISQFELRLYNRSGAAHGDAGPDNRNIETEFDSLWPSL